MNYHSTLLERFSLMITLIFSMTLLTAQIDTIAIKERIKKSFQEAKQLHEANQYDASHILLNEVISLSETIGDINYIFTAQTVRASALLQEHKYDSLDIHYSEMEENVDKVNERLQCFFWFNKAQYLNQINKYNESHQSLLKGFITLKPDLVDYPLLFFGYYKLFSSLEKKFKNYKKSRELLNILEDSLTSETFLINKRAYYLFDLYNALGNLSKETDDYVSGERYYNKALKYAENTRDKSIAKYNIASALVSQKRYDEAEELLFNMKDSLLNRSTKLRKYFTLCMIYEGIEDSVKYLNTLKIFNNLLRINKFPPLEIHLNLLNAIDAYFKKDYQKSLKLSQKAVQEYHNEKESFTLSIQLAEKYVLLSHVGLQNNLDLKRNFEYLLAQKDSINALKNAEDYKELHIKYQTEQQERENESLTFENWKAQRVVKAKNLLLWIGGSALLVISLLFLFLYFLYRSTQRQNSKILSQKNQIETLNQELNHRVKNNLAFISSLINMQSRRSDSQEVKDALQESERRLLALSGVHNQLYRNETGRYVEVKEYLEEILDSLGRIFSTAEQPIYFKTSFISMKVNAEDAMRLGIIMNELITNSVKYAFNGISAPTIDIKTFINESGILTFQYLDNGPGYHQSIHRQETSKSLGLKLIELLKEQLSDRCVILI